MKKCILSILLCLVLLLGLTFPAAASEHLTHVMDNASLMTAEDRAILEAKASQMSDDYGMDIFILTENSLNGRSPQGYADDCLDYIADGHGDYYSGILFLLSMEERDLYISTCGDAIYAVTDYGISQSLEMALPYLSSGDYYVGFDCWLDAIQEYLAAFTQGSPIDGYADYSGDYYHSSRVEAVYYEEDTTPSFLLALLIGIAAGGITVAVMKGSMNTRRKQSGAREYMDSNSYRLRTQRDIFLYSNVSRTPRPRQTNTPTSRGGGSSVHRSTGGRRHGGGGRKF